MIKVDYIRDGLIEEFHEGYYVSLNPINGLKSDDKMTSPYFMRSCAKPLQATLLVDYDIDLLPEEFALCCGSHAGEDCHLKVARSIMKKFKIDENDLKCGVHAPLSMSMQNKMIVRGDNPSPLHNNCSGKHLGYLAICIKKGWNTESYFEPDHPLQVAIKEKINEMCGVEDPEKYPMTTDGCGVPILSMPLKNIAKGFVNLLKYPQILSAIKANPYIFGGENRTDTEIIQKTKNLIAKVGAGGLCVVLNVQEMNAFIIKINDCSYEARRFALFDIINRTGWGQIKYDNRIKTIAGKVVGQVVVSV
jgi:L-asparaginase II